MEENDILGVFLRIFIHAAGSLSLFAMTVYHKDEGFSSEKILRFLFLGRILSRCLKILPHMLRMAEVLGRIFR